MARIFQQEVLNVQAQYNEETDVETDIETVAEVVAPEAGEITLDMVKKVMSGAKDRFDKACKYHAGSEEKDPGKFQKYHQKAKTAFRRAAFLCKTQAGRMDAGDPLRARFIENQGDAYVNGGVMCVCVCVCVCGTK